MIDARALHGWLGIDTPFHLWIARRLKEYGFEDGPDFRTEMFKTRGRRRKEYLLTIDMAKELAMVERAPIRRMTRASFTETELFQLELGRGN